MQSTSLVKYNTPTLVNSSTTTKGKKGEKKPAEKTNTQTEDILNSILPPRFYFTTYIQFFTP